MKALVGAFNQEKALVGAFSVIVQLHRLIDFLNTYPLQPEVCLEMPRRHVEELLQAREVRGDVVSR